MKIYTRIVFDMRTLAVLEEEFFEYFGPIAECKGDTEVEAAPVTPEETEYRKLTNQQITQQMADEAAMKPLLVQSYGYIDDGKGGYRKMTTEEKRASMTEDETRQYEIKMATAQKELDALNGNLPISPALEKSLSSEEAQADEYYSQMLGPNWRLSTPGITGMTNLKGKNDMVREEARRGMIDTAAGINASNNNIANMNKASSTGDINSFDTRLLPMVGALTSAQSPYAADRSMQFSANVENARNAGASQSGWMSMLGTLGGAGMGALSKYASAKVTPGT